MECYLLLWLERGVYFEILINEDGFWGIVVLYDILGNLVIVLCGCVGCEVCC